MENHEKLRILAGILLITSAITHNLQLLFYGTETNSILAAIYGIAYGILGILLIVFRKNKLLAVLGGIVPVVGGVLGLSRLIIFFLLPTGEINVFIIYHLIVDIIVVPICWYDFYRLHRLQKNQ